MGFVFSSTQSCLGLGFKAMIAQNKSPSNLQNHLQHDATEWTILFTLLLFIFVLSFTHTQIESDIILRKTLIEEKTLKIKYFHKTVPIIIIILICMRDSCTHVEAAKKIKMNGLSHFLSGGMPRKFPSYVFLPLCYLFIYFCFHHSFSIFLFHSTPNNFMAQRPLVSHIFKS